MWCMHALDLQQPHDNFVWPLLDAFGSVTPSHPRTKKIGSVLFSID